MKPTLLLPSPGPPPAKAVTDAHRRIVQRHLRQLALLVAHGGKADVLRGHGLAAQPARVLLRKKALGNNDEEVNVQERRADGHAENQRLVAQHPAQRRVVFVVKPLEGVFAEAIDAARAGSRRAT